MSIKTQSISATPNEVVTDWENIVAGGRWAEQAGRERANQLADSVRRAENSDSEPVQDAVHDCDEDE